MYSNTYDKDVRYMGCKQSGQSFGQCRHALPEIPGLKLPFVRQKCTMPKTINHEQHCLQIVYFDITQLVDSESNLSLCNRKV